MKFYNEGKMIIKSWCNNPEDSCIAQALNLSNLPFLAGPVCLMPDTHMGFGMPIGGVIALDGVVIPNAVGVDIGCGMSAIKTSLKKDELPVEKIKEILSLVRKSVPVGFEHHKDSQEEFLPITEGSLPTRFVSFKEYKKACFSLGTLGGGNHFIEIQYDEEGNIWFMIHSGSRNLGKQVCDYYKNKAKELNEKYHSSVPVEWGLSFLPIVEEIGQDYFKEMLVCLKYSTANRNLMGRRIKEAFSEVMKNVSFEDEINIQHNYASMENHHGKNVMIHRKGATSAKAGEIGLIPGSQGTASYVVEGLGNPDSYTSCSHGAGRKMGRKEAQRSLNFEAEKKLLDDQGIVHAIRSKDDLEEASGAYKDIDVVMEEQKDLVKIVHKLLPLAVIKG